MKKTLITTAAVLALAGAAAAPASATDCFGPQSHSPQNSVTISTAQDRSFGVMAQTGSPSFQSVQDQQISTQSVEQTAAPSGQGDGADAVTTEPTPAATTTVDATPEATPAVTTQSTNSGGTATSSSFSDQVAQEMLGMLNQARSDAGLAPLSTNADLTGIASGWSQQMAANNAASHSPTFIEQTQATGSTNMAENVSYDVTSGNSVQETAQYFYNFWMNSPGHYANIMNPDFNAIGFSLAESDSGYVYATQNFGTY